MPRKVMRSAYTLAEQSSAAAAEVEWYLRNGKYPEQRIATASDGTKYVIGDFSWNRNGRPHEIIEPYMNDGA